MKIAVLSGKGGTGKTFVSVNLAATADHSLYLDCDVEEPNGHLFLKPENIRTEGVYKLLPSIDGEKCTGCRTCVDFCRFNALAFLKKKPMVFADICHSCGGCAMLCPNHAITETKKEIGHIEIGTHKNITAVTGLLNIGESSGVPIINSVLAQADKAKKEDIVVVDCPPGSACSVMESIESADYCIIVAEPTAFGIHNFEMVHELVQILKKKFGVVINKAPEERTVLDDLLEQENIPLLCRIPFSRKTAGLGANAEIVSEKDDELKGVFKNLLETVRKEAAV